jgi:rhodanese-related sulfurtransferase
MILLTRRMFMKRKTGLILVSVIALTLAGCGIIGGSKSELAVEKSAVKFAREVVRGGYGIVSTEELKKWMDAKKDMLIIDTMPAEKSYDKNHIPGAVNFIFPIPELEKMKDEGKSAFKKMLGDNPEKLIVVYCGFTKCSRSHNGAMWAVKLGYKNVFRHPGGIKGWKEAGYSIEKK